MEPLIFVEVLTRHGDVAQRYRVSRLPVTVGRGYDSDIILDDPFVAPQHIRIEASETGELKAIALETKNGISVPGSARRVREIVVDPDQPLRIGHTQLRIRRRGYAVPQERTATAGRWYREPLTALALLLAAMGCSLASSYTVTFQRTETLTLIMPTLWVTLGLLTWTGLWGLAARLGGGKANLAAHLANVSSGMVVLLLILTGIQYIAFSLSSQLPLTAWYVLWALVVAWVLYRQLRLVSRQTVCVLACTASSVAALAVGALWLADLRDEATRFTELGYLKQIKSPAFRLVHGDSPARFFAGMEKVKPDVDALKHGE